MERKESKTKAGAEKQELVGVSGLTLDFLLSSKVLMSGSRAQHHESGCSHCVRCAATAPSVLLRVKNSVKKKNPEPGKIEIYILLFY